MPDWLAYVLLVVAAFLAGGVNAIAGGGTLITFPVLLALGFDPKVANGTSTVALWPWSIGSAYGYRAELRDAPARRTLARLAIPLVLGGALGTALVVWTPSRAFSSVVPFLILAATLLFAMSGRATRRAAEVAQSTPRASRTSRTALGIAAQVAIAIYGGYFGAGLGILLLALLAHLNVGDIHRANALKALLGMLVNGAAIFVFAASGLVAWPAALAMAAASMIGGFAGAALAQRLPARLVRAAVIVLGLCVGIALAVRELA